MEFEKKRFSLGGVILASLTALLAILLLVSNTPQFLLGIVYLVPAAAMLWRAFHPPVGWKKGLATWFGGYICGTPFGFISMYSIEPRLKGAEFNLSLTSFFVLIIGIFVLRNGLTQPKRKCPFCAEFIQAEAIKCKYCGSDTTLVADKNGEGDIIGRSHTT